MLDQVVGRGGQHVVGQRVQCIEDEERRSGVVVERGAASLTPVPAPAGHPRVVAPDDLTGRRVLDDRAAFRHGVERFLTSCSDQPRRSAIAGEVLAAERDLVQHRDRVVEVGEPVNAWQPGLGSTQQCFETVAGALGLGAERPIGIAPGRDVGQVLYRPFTQRFPSCLVGRVDQRVARRIARPWDEPDGGHQKGAVVGSQHEHGRIDMGASEELLRRYQVRHRPPPT